MVRQESSSETETASRPSVSSVGQARRARQQAARAASYGKLRALEKRVQQLEAENVLLRAAAGVISKECHDDAQELPVHVVEPEEFYGVSTSDAAVQAHMLPGNCVPGVLLSELGAPAKQRFW